MFGVRHRGSDCSRHTRSPLYCSTPNRRPVNLHLPENGSDPSAGSRTFRPWTSTRCSCLIFFSSRIMALRSAGDIVRQRTEGKRQTRTPRCGFWRPSARNSTSACSRMLRRLSTSTLAHTETWPSSRHQLERVLPHLCVVVVGRLFRTGFVTWSAAGHRTRTRQAVSATTVAPSPAAFSNISISPNTPPLSSRSRMVRLPLLARCAR